MTPYSRARSVRGCAALGGLLARSGIAGCIIDRMGRCALLVAGVITLALTNPRAQAQTKSTSLLNASAQPGQGYKLVPGFYTSQSFDGRRLLVARGGGATLWDLETGGVSQRFEGHGVPVNAVALSPDGTQVVTGSGLSGDVSAQSRDNSVRLWDVATGKQARQFNGHTAYVHTVQFSPDGTFILSVGADSTARIWSRSGSGQPFTFPNYTFVIGESSGAAFSPDSTRVLSARERGSQVTVWSTASGQALFSIACESGMFFAARWSPDGKLLLTAASDGTVRTWDGQTGQQVRVFAGHTSFVMDASFSADGARITTASRDRTARLWDANSGQVIRQFPHIGKVNQVILSGDARRLLTNWATDEVSNRVSLWDVQSGQELRRFVGEDAEGVGGLSFDGAIIPVVNRSGELSSLWSGMTGSLIKRY